MKTTLLRLWQFSRRRQNTLLAALALSFLRSALGVTQILAVLTALQVLTGALALSSGIRILVVLTLICLIGGFAISYAEQLCVLKSGLYTVADQRTETARLLRRMPLGFFRQSTAKHITAVLTNTMQDMEMASTMTMVGIVSGLFNAAACFLFLLWLDWRAGLVSGLGILSYLAVVGWQMRASRRNAPARQAAQTGLATAALTFLQGIRVLKSFCPQNGGRELRDAIRQSSDANIGLTDRSMPSQCAAHLTIAVFSSLLLFQDLICTLVTGEYGPVQAVTLLILSFFAFASLDQAGSILSMIGMVESGLREVLDIQSAPLLPQDRRAEVPDGQSLCLDHVCFSYGDREILHDLTVQLRPHTLTAIIGPSGAGKTTLCQLLARFQDVDSGSITLGGVDLRAIPYETLMEQISMVFQNVYLFEDTILNNIRFGRPDATLEQVREAARAARCDDFIMALPEGYDTLVREGGVSLSGGEKQRISIARAILKDAPIILLDEATSALDAENERAFFDAVDTLTQEKTVVMIAHRLSTVERADRILALRDGRIVQDGPPAQLAREPGLYADFLASRRSAALWQLQNQALR